MDALNGQTKILLLSADPVNLEPLRLAQERRDVETERSIPLVLYSDNIGAFHVVVRHAIANERL